MQIQKNIAIVPAKGNMPLSGRIACYSVFVLLLCTSAAFSADMERTEIAPDNWTFRGAESHDPFTPVGTNYTPAWGGWAPDYFSDRYWDEAKVAADFAEMEALGLNVAKVVFTPRRMLPDPQAPGAVTPGPEVMVRVDRMIELAGKHNLRLMVTFNPTWGPFPDWFTSGGGWYGPDSHAIMAEFWELFARRHAGDGRIWAYSFSVEADPQMIDNWDSTEALQHWRDWAREQYGSVAAANAAWGTTCASWDDITVPGYDGRNAEDWQLQPEGTDANENLTGDQKLYDYLLFREYTAFRFMRNCHDAVKRGDPDALTSMGFIQWNPIVRHIWAPFSEGPVRGPEHNVKELAKAVDFVGIHFYPVWPDGDHEAQMRYLELWARYAFAGKPVVLEEFNADPPEKNVWYVPEVMRRTRGVVSGWLVWTFQDVAGSDQITKVCGLIDADRERTALGRAFPELSRDVQSWALRREPAEWTIRADKEFLFTSGDYRWLMTHFIEELEQGSVDFEMEENASVERWLGR